MILPKFELSNPESIEEALRLLGEGGEGVRLLAGGTDVLVDLRRRPTTEVGIGGGSRSKAPSLLISLLKVRELQGIDEESEGRLRVGASSTMTALARSEVVRRRCGALAEGAAAVGSPLIRNRATYAGNLIHASPACDTGAPSLVLGARLEVVSLRGKREIGIEEFFLGPGRSALKSDEIVTAICFPASSPASGSAYVKLGRRKCLEISINGVAAALTLDESGRVERARIGLGSVGPRPLLAKEAAESLQGEAPTEERLKEAARLAREEASPISDHRGADWYRSQMIEVLTQRMLESALERARQGREESR